MAEWFIVIVLGLVLGSFLNVVVYRLPRQETVVRSRSRCPHCDKTLGVLDLLPVLSYVFLKGRCRYCRGGIAIQYPLVELGTALILFYSFHTWSWSWPFLAYSVLFLLLIPAMVIDWQHMILPDQITLGGLVLALMLAIFGDHITFIQALLGLVAGGGLLLLLAFIFPQGMGGGDIKMMAMVGAFTGWPYVLGAIFLGALLGLLYFALAYSRGKVGRETPLPFGTFLALGTFLSLSQGPALLNWYISLFVF